MRERKSAMAAIKITENLYSVGILNPNMRIFDVVMRTEYGTTYNSYLLRGEQKTALIETCHKTYFEQYLSNIREVADTEQIDYIILNHCEPDHSGALAELLGLCPNAEILVSRAGAIYLKNITNREDLKIRFVKDGESIDLGGRQLRFISAPFLHWPDSMFTWDEQDKTLFSCDMFGSHYCEPHTFDYNIVYPGQYQQALKGYYDAIFGPFKPYVLAGMEKIADLPIERICTSHGPVLSRGCLMEKVMEQYRAWSQPAAKEQKSIPVFYCSAYGNTGKIAQAIAQGIKEALPEANCPVYDVNDHDMGFLQGELNASDAFAVGSPTINQDAVAPVWNLLSHVDAINNKKRPALVFGSYGWSGEAVPNLTARLTGLKSSVFGEGFKVTFVPSDEDLCKAKELGKAFAESL